MNILPTSWSLEHITKAGKNQGGEKMELIRKSDQVRALVASGQYKEALRIAKGFRLGISKEDSGKMTQAYECLIHPSFYESIGVNIEETIQDGVDIIRSLYGGLN